MLIVAWGKLLDAAPPGRLQQPVPAESDEEGELRVRPGGGGSGGRASGASVGGSSSAGGRGGGPGSSTSSYRPASFLLTPETSTLHPPPSTLNSKP